MLLYYAILAAGLQQSFRRRCLTGNVGKALQKRRLASMIVVNDYFRQGGLPMKRRRNMPTEAYAYVGRAKDEPVSDENHDQGDEK